MQALTETGRPLPQPFQRLTHWGPVTHICVSKLAIIGSDNDLSPGRRQSIIWTNAGLLSKRPLGTKFSENLIKMHTFSLNNIHLKISSGKWRPFFLSLKCYNLIMSKTSRTNSGDKAGTTMTPPLQWITNAKHHNLKMSSHKNNTGKYTACLSVQSSLVYNPLSSGYNGSHFAYISTSFSRSAHFV